MIAALDATYSVGPALSGVGVYCREILAGAAQASPADKFLHCYRPHVLWRGLRAQRERNASVRPLFERWVPFSCDLFHGLNQRLPRRRFRRTICTFHDLFVLTSEYSTPQFRARFAQRAREAAARADLIICVSAFTASQVEQLLGVDRGRLRVIHHGTRFVAPPPAQERQPWILHVGALQRRKNIVRLVEAFEIAVPPPWRLILAGGSGFDAEVILQRIAASPAHERIDVTGWVDDARLAEFYGRASIFAFPSLDEGFGIPVLEAMAWGLPVVASNGSALPEVCGGAACLVEPGDTAAWSEALSRLIGDPDYAASLARLGQTHARQRPWSSVVQETLRVYRELL